MSQTDTPSPETLKQAIIDLQEPVVFHRILEDNQGGYVWKLLEWNLSEVAEKFGDLKLPFRIGYNMTTKHPQWEYQCSIETMTFKEFIEAATYTHDKKWYYFDYKYMSDWFQNKPEIMTSLNWGKFGFDKSGIDSTMWIGSKGAHTNCHQDSYGCNLVAQIHGRKEWLLFPPDTSNMMQPTRIPYEESTVYSKFNFFSPTEEDAKNITALSGKARSITLAPGDVLFVPKGWWHFVESVDVSISVNIWLPVETDNESRLKEALVKLIVSRIGKKVSPPTKDIQNNLSYCTRLVQLTLQECEQSLPAESAETSKKRSKYSTWTAEELIVKYPQFITQLCILNKSELEKFLQKKRERFVLNKTNLPNTTEYFNDENISSTLDSRISESIVNAFCHPDIIDKVTELLLHLK